jgi:hypothetical protein
LLFISPCPDPESDPTSVKWMSGKEFWSFDLDDFIDPPPFDFLRRDCLGTAGRSCDGKSFPFIEFRCRLVCRALPGESRYGESISTDASVERWRLECFGASQLRRGVLAGEPWPLPADLICWSRDSLIPAPLRFIWSTKKRKKKHLTNVRVLVAVILNFIHFLKCRNFF